METQRILICRITVFFGNSRPYLYLFDKQLLTDRIWTKYHRIWTVFAGGTLQTRVRFPAESLFRSLWSKSLGQNFISRASSSSAFFLLPSSTLSCICIIGIVLLVVMEIEPFSALTKAKFGGPNS
jgi:hypothetical protein